jgi:hypothetical protein
MEIEAAVGNDSESRYQRLQIGAEVTILGRLRASTEVNSMSVRTSEDGLDEGQRFRFDVLVGWLFWISHAMHLHLPLAAPAVQDLGGSDQRLCRARGETGAVANQKERSRWGRACFMLEVRPIPTTGPVGEILRSHSAQSLHATPNISPS